MAAPITPPIAPVFSHGDAPAVAGNGVSNGKAIAIFRAAGLNWPAMDLQVIGAGGMTVIVQKNPGPLGVDGEPDPNAWADHYTKVFAGAGADEIALPPAYPYWRTRISAYTGGSLKSCVPLIPLPSGDVASAQYVSMKAGGNQ